MKRRTWIVWAQDTALRFGRVDRGRLQLVSKAFPLEQAESSVDELSAALEEASYRSEPCVLLLPTTWIYSAMLEVGSVPRKSRREALEYRFEELLPHALEELTVEVTEHSGRAFALAVESARVQPILARLQTSKVWVDVITAESLATQEGARARYGRDTVLFESSGMLELISLGGSPSPLWHLLPRDRGVLTHAAETLGTRERGVAMWLSAGDPPPELHHLDLEVEAPADGPGSRDELSAEGGARVAAGSSRAPWNLAHGVLRSRSAWSKVRKPAWAAAASLLVVLAVFGHLTLGQIRALEEDARASRAATRALYEEIFPGEPVPVGIRRRLESRLVELSGLHASMPEEERTSEESALLTLYETLRLLPDGMRYLVLDLRIDGVEIDISGHARSHSEAERIASALSVKDRFSVEPPTTERLKDEGVSFAFRAQLVSGARDTKEGRP